jgi:outer membrane receptor for ferrienterochelin and colicins
MLHRTRLYLGGAFLFFVAFLAPTVVAAQAGGIVGTVLDETSRASLSAVHIEVRNASGAMVAEGITGPSGSFRINDVPAGNYTIRFNSAGWSTVTATNQQVSAGQVTTVSVSMSEESFSLNPLTVTVSKTQDKVLDAPAAISVVQTRAIEERPAITIADHVKAEPGVDVIQTGLQSSYVTLRGFNNLFSGATLTMTDNRIASVPSLRANIAHLNPITSLDLDRVEIVLGPASALYGPNASNGVIHSITKSPIDHPGTTFAVGAGSREQGNTWSHTDQDTKGLFHVEGRVAVAPSEKFGFKVSGQYFGGTEFTYRDPAEMNAQAFAQGCIASMYNPAADPCAGLANGLNPADPADQAILRTAVDNVAAGRNNDLERMSFDARMDFRPNPETSIVINGGRNNSMSSVDLTGLGSAQIVDWGYNYVQGRMTHKDLFAQVFFNKSDNEDSYLLGTGRPVVDKSSMMVAQLQHQSSLGDRHHLVYGTDLLMTRPDTEGHINGKFEDIDNLTEFGGYAQWEWNLDPKWDFIGAVRADKSSGLENVVFSPRAAFVYKPDVGSSARLTFNRSFTTPSTLNMFLDISGGTLPIGPFTYDIRATGSTDVGHMYQRDSNGIPMHMSPFNVLLGGSARTFLPTTSAQLWSEAVALVGASSPALASLLALVPAPTDDQVGIIPLLLNPGVANGTAPVPAGCVAAPFCDIINLATLQDIPALRPTITNTLELGYKNLFTNRVLFGVNAWWSHISDYTSALRMASPNLFLNGQDVGAHLAQAFMPLVGVAFPDAATAQATAAQLAGTIASLPLGAVTPTSVGGSAAGMAYVYENLGSVDVYGAEVGATFSVSDRILVVTNVAIIDKNEFEATRFEQPNEIIPLNAPTIKMNAAMTYRDDDAGYHGGLRFRVQNGFNANSGAYSGNVDGFGVLDVSGGFRIPGFDDLWFQADVQNAFNNSYQTFVGAPELGRMVLARMRWDVN